MSRNAKPDCPVILSILIGLEGLCDDQSDYVILIDSDYVRKWNDKRVKCGKSLLIDIFSHMKREKNPRHFAPKVKCKKEWHVVILSFSTSFLTWNVKRIQDTLLPKWKWEGVIKLLLDNIWPTKEKSE